MAGPLRRRLLLWLGAAVALLASATPVGAEDGPTGVAEGAAKGRPLWMREPRWRLRAELATTGLLASDFDAGGSVGSLVHDVGLAADRALWMGARLTLGATYELRVYDFSGPNPLFPTLREPFREVHTVGASATLFQALSESWAVVLTTALAASAERDAPLEDGVTIAFTGGVGHRFSDAFTAGVGAFYAIRFSGDAIFVPGPQFDWRVDERWRLVLEGATLTLGHRFDATHDLALVAGFDSRRFRLDDAAPKRRAVVGDSRGAGALVYTYRPEENVDVRLSVGLDVFRQMWVEEAQGDRVYDLDPNLTVGASVTVRF